jgi:hypothetical protein
MSLQLCTSRAAMYLRPRREDSKMAWLTLRAIFIRMAALGAVLIAAGPARADHWHHHGHHHGGGEFFFGFPLLPIPVPVPFYEPSYYVSTRARRRTGPRASSAPRAAILRRGTLAPRGWLGSARRTRRVDQRAPARLGRKLTRTPSGLAVGAGARAAGCPRLLPPDLPRRQYARIPPPRSVGPATLRSR